MVRRWLPLLACLFATPAYATGVYHLRLAAAEIPPGSACTRVTVNIPSGTPYTAIRCPGTGDTNSFTINTVYPTDATAVTGFQETMHVTSADSSPSGNACWKRCYGVVRAGQSRNNLALTQCDLTGNVTLGAQYVEAIQINNTQVDPKDSASPTANTCGSLGVYDGSTNVCPGQTLVVQWTRLNSVCSNNYAGYVDFKDADERYP